jgi:aerobic carbon-monoxide dehydrogenase small subunit
MRISMIVNNQEHTSEIEPRLLLVDYLRDVLGLTGAKIGCDTGQCGTCLVMVNGQSIKSCLMLAAQADGAEVLTVEGIAAPGKLTTLQEGFQQRHGVQCGFCTPGMVVALSELRQKTPNPTEVEIRSALEGVMCRCTGYQNVVGAVQYAVEIDTSPVKMICDTPAKKFYRQQVEYLIAGDADALVEANYNDSAVLTSPEFTMHGKDELKKHFRNYLKWVKIQEVLSTDKFVETDNTVLFEATVRSNHGVVKVYDTFVLRDGKIDYHFTGVK